MSPKPKRSGDVDLWSLVITQQQRIEQLEQALQRRSILRRVAGRPVLFGVASGVAALAISTSAFAGIPLKIPDASGVIHGCYSKSSGNLRVIDSSCNKGEKALSWNQRGPKGAKGDQGGESPGRELHPRAGNAALPQRSGVFEHDMPRRHQQQRRRRHLRRALAAVGGWRDATRHDV